MWRSRARRQCFGNIVINWDEPVVSKALTQGEKMGECKNKVKLAGTWMKTHTPHTHTNKQKIAH